MVFIILSSFFLLMGGTWIVPSPLHLILYHRISCLSIGFWKFFRFFLKVFLWGEGFPSPHFLRLDFVCSTPFKVGLFANHLPTAKLGEEVGLEYLTCVFGADVHGILNVVCHCYLPLSFFWIAGDLRSPSLDLDNIIPQNRAFVNRFLKLFLIFLKLFYLVIFMSMIAMTMTIAPIAQAQNRYIFFPSLSLGRWGDLVCPLSFTYNIISQNRCFVNRFRKYFFVEFFYFSLLMPPEFPHDSISFGKFLLSWYYPVSFE